MSWKERLQIQDLPDITRIEICCANDLCGSFRFVSVERLKLHWFIKQQYLDEFEKTRYCNKHGCHGPCRISLPADSQTEGFQGGLA